MRRARPRGRGDRRVARGPVDALRVAAKREALRPGCGRCGHRAAARGGGSQGAALRRRGARGAHPVERPHGAADQLHLQRRGSTPHARLGTAGSVRPEPLPAAGAHRRARARCRAGQVRHAQVRSKSGVHGGRLQPAAGCGRRGVESVSRLPGALRGPVRGHCARRVPLRGRRHQSRPGARVLPARLGPGEEGLRAGPGSAQGNALSHRGTGLDQVRERRLRRRDAARTGGGGALRDAAAGGRVGSRGRPASAARHDPARGRFAA